MVKLDRFRPEWNLSAPVYKPPPRAELVQEAEPAASASWTRWLAAVVVIGGPISFGLLATVNSTAAFLLSKAVYWYDVCSIVGGCLAVVFWFCDRAGTER